MLLLPLLLLLGQGTAISTENSTKPVTLPITRHTGLKHDGLRRRRGESGSSTHPTYLTNFRNSFFTVPVLVGTKTLGQPQQLDLLVNTGTPYTYVYGAGCVGHDPKSERFRGDKSETYRPFTSAGTHRFGDSSFISGDWGFDTIGFVGSTPVESQMFINARYAENEPWSGLGMEVAPDGVVGLGLPQRVDAREAYPLWMRTPESGRPLPMFSIYLRTSANPPLARPPRELGGEITFGGINEKCISEEPTWNKVTSRGQWHIKLDRLQIGEAPFLVDLSTNEALIDTGSDLVYGPAKDVSRFYLTAAPGKTVKQGSRYRLMDLSELQRPEPHISFLFNDHEYAIAKGQMWYQQGVDRNGVPIFYGFLEDNVHTEEWIIGTPLLSNVYTSFRIAPHGPEVGFSPLKQTPDGGYACG